MPNKDLEFMECDTCRAKGGMPVLCEGCLHNRDVITRLKKQTVIRCQQIAIEDSTDAGERIAEAIGGEFEPDEG